MDSFIHFIVAPDVKQDDLLFRDYDGHGDPIAVGNADCLHRQEPGDTKSRDCGFITWQEREQKNTGTTHKGTGEHESMNL